MPSGPTGIDAIVELEHHFSMADDSEAFWALQTGTLYRYVQQGLDGPDRVMYQDTVASLIRRFGIWWSPSIYSVFPTLVPWAVRDRSCRYDQGPENWGSPRADGRLRDDNSIIKKLPLTLTVAAPAGHPYAGRKPWRGFTACHVWRDIASDAVAGESEMLYSFLPNLVWLPRPLAPLTDSESSFAQTLLKLLSRKMFEAIPVAAELGPYIEKAWSMLPSGPPTVPDGYLSPQGLPTFTASLHYLSRRLNYNRRVADGVAALLEGRSSQRKIICSRYTTGLPLLGPGVLSELVVDLRRYDAAVAAALHQVPRAT